MGREEQDPLSSAKSRLLHYTSVIEHRSCLGQALHKKSVLQQKHRDHRNKNGVTMTRKLNHSSGLNA